MFEKFTPCYLQSPLQLCHEIYISSNSRNLLREFLHTVKETGGNLIEIHTHFSLWFKNPYRNVTFENTKVMPRSLNKIVRS
jgi:hypothetical protein